MSYQISGRRGSSKTNKIGGRAHHLKGYSVDVESSRSKFLSIGEAFGNVPACRTDPLAAYTLLQGTFAKDVKGEANQQRIGEIFRACSHYLAKLERLDLKSLVPGKCVPL